MRSARPSKKIIFFHPRNGGDLVNVTPSDVRMESYVRASNVPAMIDANERITAHWLLVQCLSVRGKSKIYRVTSTV